MIKSVFNHFRKIKPVIILTSAIFLISCSSYNTSFPPPRDDAEAKDVFPAEINGITPELVGNNDIGGMDAYYGDNMYIYVGRFKDSDEANNTFKAYFAEKINKMQRHVSGSFNGQWRAEGTESNGREWYGWVNDKYVFAIWGADKEYLYKVIDAFKFIER